MITLVPIAGFLGAGKTTAMLAAARHIKAGGRSVAIVTNDQGDNLVDTALGRASALPVGEVTGGCFCCRFDQFVEVVSSLVREHRAEMILAEAVGSCTDLMATVVRPIERYHGNEIRVARLTVMVDPARYRALGRGRRRSAWFPAQFDELLNPAAYLFRKQCEEAELIVLTKIDVLSARARETECSQLAKQFPNARIAMLSSTTGIGVAELIEAWQSTSRAHVRDVDLDYDIYAEAEARLAWLNAACEIDAEHGGLEPAGWVEACLRALEAELEPAGALVGHVKIQLATDDGLTQASIVAAGQDPVFTQQHATSARSARVLVNARAEIAPARLQRALEVAVARADSQSRVVTSIVTLESFSPARPRPTYRLSSRDTI